MDAIRKIEAALSGFATFPVWHETSPDDVVHAVRNENARIVADVGYSGDEEFDKTICRYIAACDPATISEVLQTLASKEAELAAREAEIARLLELLAGCRTVFALALDNGKNEQYASLETRRGSFIHCVKLMQELDSALTKQPPKD